MKKLAIVCGSLGKGGAERITLYLASYMRYRGVKTIIITGGRHPVEYKCPKYIERYVLNESKEGTKIEGKGIALLFYQIMRLRNILLEQCIDTVLIMDVPVCVYAIPGCQKTKVKVIVSERNAPTHFSGKKTIKWISRILMRKADGFVFQTKEVQNYYGSFFYEKSIVIPNPVFIESMPKIQYTGEREKKIVSVARLNKQKNQKMLIKAFSLILNEYPEYKLYIWGEGPERKNIENYIRSLGIQKSVFLPGITENVFEEIYDASMFVLTSDFEGMPNALIEAMALGLPCISTDCPCGGPRELIENNRNGILIPVNDKDALVKNICYLLENKEFTIKIGNEAFKIRERLNYETICNKWYEFMKQ